METYDLLGYLSIIILVGYYTIGITRELRRRKKKNMDRIRIGRKVVKVGDLIESTKGIAQVMSINRVDDPFEEKPSMLLTEVRTNCKTVLLKDINIIYKRNAQQGFDRYEVRGKK